MTVKPRIPFANPVSSAVFCSTTLVSFVFGSICSKRDVGLPAFAKYNLPLYSTAILYPLQLINAELSFSIYTTSGSYVYLLTRIMHGVPVVAVAPSGKFPL